MKKMEVIEEYDFFFYPPLFSLWLCVYMLGRAWASAHVWGQRTTSPSTSVWVLRMELGHQADLASTFIYWIISQAKNDFFKKSVFMEKYLSRNNEDTGSQKCSL